ncbi:hypothetical protein PCASD_15767 [Puccinia coronata f. sp. avenae]|uniref:Uncharacterized protein n=1 Tax=Puccinia coronata f. sp. avenae TaxID=200324 RepID=A0A2N5TX20_9BASI|nr:hypothetical protein PCASD_15767 [Puccinia coronata f. sp. avenae]
MASDSLANLGFHFNFQKSPVKVKKPQHPKTSPVKVKKSRQPKNSPVKVKKPWPPKKKNFSTHKINPKQSNVAITGKSSPNETKKANYAPPNNSPSIKIPNMPVDILKDMKEVLHLHGLQLQEDSSKEMIHPAFQGNVTMPDLPEAPQTLIQASKGDLCVFCDEPMPLNPSCRLKKLGEYLQAKPEVQHRREPTNPWALHLPFPLKAGYCQMHQAELSIIPHGLAKQWPSTIDFENVPRRVEHLQDHLFSISDKRVPSCYLDGAINSWTTLGKHKSQSLFYDINSFELEQPGYSSGARTAVFDRWSDGHCPTEARANWSDRFVRPVPAGPVRPVPGTDRTGLSDPPAGALVGQCLSGHQSNTAVRAPLELPCSTG